MSFDRSALISACEIHGKVARVVVASVRGSAPRGVGAAMLVWADGISGTIGGGTLEHQAIQAARELATPGQHVLTRHALGPDLGQCCGGSVDLFTDVFDADYARAVPEDVVARGSGEIPLAVVRLKSKVRNSGVQPDPQLVAGWMVEPVRPVKRQLWIWGAGHVGRALVDVMSPLADVATTWVDIHANRFPDCVPDGVDVIATERPEVLASHAPQDAEHLIVTYSHDLDLELCHRLLQRGFVFAGLIGSQTKWARFRTRLEGLGHAPAAIARITCPIGDPSLGKHPQAIALGVGARFLAHQTKANEFDLEGYA